MTIASAALLMVILTPTLLWADGGLRTVALSGQQAAGAPAGVTYGFFSDVVLNANGQTAFAGQLSGPGVDLNNDEAIWSEVGGGGPGLVARAGEQPPGTPSGQKFLGFFGPDLVLNSNGQLAFNAVIITEGLPLLESTDRSIWTVGGGQGLTLVARGGDAAPGTPTGVVYDSLRGPLLNASGEVAFEASLTGPGLSFENNSGIWSNAGGGGVALVGRGGDPIPGQPTGVVFRFPGSPVLNNDGKIAFESFGSSGGFVAVGSAGTVAIEAPNGILPPGVGPGVGFAGASSPAINAAGELAFYGSLSGLGIGATNAEGLFTNAGGAGLRLVARTGDAAVGAPTGAVFGPFIEGASFSSPVINAAGRVAFEASVSGGGFTDENGFADGSGIWTRDPGEELSLVALQGQQAPGTPQDTTFEVFGGPSINAEGQVAFTAFLSGENVSFENSLGIWAQTTTGELALLARVGDQIDVDDDPLTEDLRTITGLNFRDRSFALPSTGNEDGRGSLFNDRGELAFIAQFSDGSSGVFVSSLAALAPGVVAGNFNGDNIVNAADYAALRDSGGNVAGNHAAFAANFGGRSAVLVSSTTIPEPMSAVLMLGALNMLAVIRRR